MKVNGFIKFGSVVLVIVLVVAFVREGSTPSEDEKAPEVTKVPDVTSSDSGTATVTTLITRDAERENEVSQLTAEIESLKQLIQTGQTESTDTAFNDEDINKIEDKVNEKFESQRTEIDKLAEKINKLSDSGTHLVGEMKNTNFFDTKNPLNETDYEINNAQDTIWTYPLDQQRETLIDDGVFVAKQWVDGVTEKFDSANPITESVTEETKKPVYTIPENTTLIGAKLASRIVAQVPKSGAVNNPMGFKVVVPAKALAANGFVIDQLKEAQMGGYAVGNWALKCARGYITSFTFIFEDGRISQVGSNFSNTGQDNVTTNTLAVLTDTAGTECVAGKLHSNAPEFITTKVALGAAAGAASAYAGAQETVTKGSDSTSSAITGSTGKYIAGQAFTDGVNQGSSYVDEIWKEVTDSVSVDIATAVNIEIKQPIHIDYDTEGRKVVHEFNLNDRKAMEAYWQ